MNLTLVRKEYSAQGVFGELRDEGGNLVAVTLEHAYDECQPKLPLGTYSCLRGSHRLDGMTRDFEAFEITGVPGHTGILFHVGNTAKDSSGCVLLGLRRDGVMILGSKLAFDAFMALQKGLGSFSLSVVDSL